MTRLFVDERSSWHMRDALQKRVQVLENELTTLKPQLETVQASLKNLKKQLEATQTQLTDAQRGASELKLQLAEERQKISQIEIENTRLKSLEQQRDDETKQMAAIVRGPAITIPSIAQGYEAIYQRFLKGILVYRPQEGSDAGRIDLPIAALANPLGCTFDLSRCSDTSTYLSISTGYRKANKAKNEFKVEIWIAPRFLIQRELATTAGHFLAIKDEWAADATVGIFWNWGNYNNMQWYDYLTSQNMENLSKNNLYSLYEKSACAGKRAVTTWARAVYVQKFQFVFLS